MEYLAPRAPLRAYSDICSQLPKDLQNNTVNSRINNHTTVSVKSTESDPLPTQFFNGSLPIHLEYMLDSVNDVLPFYMPAEFFESARP